jgi:hypothetical protein
VVEGQAHEPRDAVVPDRPLPGRRREQRELVVAARAGDRAHVLHAAEHPDLPLREEVQQLPRVEVRDVLRCHDDERGADRERLDDGLGHVPGARREVDEQVVQVAPVDAGAHAPDHEARHRAGGREGLPLGDEELQGHDAHPLQLHGFGARGAQPRRLPHRDVARGHRARDAEHQRDVGAVEVGVEDADPQPPGAQRPAERDDDGRLAHAALAAADGDDLADHGATAATIAPAASRPASAHSRRNPDSGRRPPAIPT